MAPGTSPAGDEVSKLDIPHMTFVKRLSRNMEIPGSVSPFLQCWCGENRYTDIHRHGPHIGTH